MHQPSVKEIEKDLDENFRPVLRSHKKKGEMSWWGQVDDILGNWASSETRCFSRLVVSKWNVVFAYSIMKMMVPQDCHALLKKKIIVTKATSLVITVHPCCNVISKLVQM